MALSGLPQGHFYTMRTETRRQSLTLLDVSSEHAPQAMQVGYQGGTSTVDLGITDKF